MNKKEINCQDNKADTTEGFIFYKQKRTTLKMGLLSPDLKNFKFT